MAGLLRNIITLVLALLVRGRAQAGSAVSAHFRITPLDCGLRILKSDRYLQLAECAQLDFLVRTGLFGRLLREGISFVNLSQLVRFSKPVAMFQRVRVETTIACTDAKCAYFSHVFFVDGQQCAQVLVKMKFKRGSLTVPPFEVTGIAPADKPARLQAWDDALAGPV
jgi:hypothetical protein